MSENVTVRYCSLWPTAGVHFKREVNQFRVGWVRFNSAYVSTSNRKHCDFHDCYIAWSFGYLWAESVFPRPRKSVLLKVLVIEVASCIYDLCFFSVPCIMNEVLTSHSTFVHSVVRWTRHTSGRLLFRAVDAIYHYKHVVWMLIIGHSDFSITY